MLTFELLKLLPNTTKVDPAWARVWDRWSPEILSTINYSVILGSIITGAVQEWCKWLPDWDSKLGLGQPYRSCPSRDPQETTRYPSRHFTQSSRTECSGPPWVGPWRLSWRETSKKAALAQGAAHQLLLASWPLRAKVRSDMEPHSSAVPLAGPWHQGGEKQEEPDPAAGKGVSGLRSQGCWGSAETQDSSITWEGPCSQGTEEGVLLLLFPHQTPESVAVQRAPPSTGGGRAEPHPSLVLTPITRKNSRGDAASSLILLCSNPLRLRRA